MSACGDRFPSGMCCVDCGWGCPYDDVDNKIPDPYTIPLTGATYDKYPEVFHRQMLDRVTLTGEEE